MTTHVNDPKYSKHQILERTACHFYLVEDCSLINEQVN